MFPRITSAVALTALLAAGFAAALAAPRPAAALDNGVARTPPMGWDNWNATGCDVNETLVKETADAMVASGMRDAGYAYVIIDDCWFDPQRDASGNLRPNADRFPGGMRALGDYLHERGLKFGLYEVPTEETCAQRGGAYPGMTGSAGHEEQDARTFASWGVDYLKYDWCSPDGTIDDQIAGFARMRDALAATGRRIVLSVNPNSYHAVDGPSRDWSDVANMWRTTEDITNAWDTGHANAYPMGIRNIIAVNAELSSYAAPGGFNDPDMLVVGNGGLTETEQRTHFAMWAMMAAPLIAGNDLRNASAATLEILTNRRLIAIDQDRLGVQGRQIAADGTRRVLAKPLANGDVAVALYNEGLTPITVATTAAEAGLRGHHFRLVDAWTGRTTTSDGRIAATVPAHGTVVYRVSRDGRGR